MNEATRRQIRAASPMASTWLAANAGSGKTRVLTDRVARLLLAGVAPQNVLCLTYTKAAASEMQNRLFKRLGAWAMCPDDKLREELTELGTAGPFSAEDLAAARRLFARAIETPGGLKIQTIHAFCGALLRRFPLEAGVSPTFTEIDDRGLDELIAQALDALASSDDPSPLDAVARFANDGKVSEICEEILQNRPLFGELPDEETVYRHLGLLPGFRLEDLLTEVFLGGEAELLAQLVAHLENGSPNDVTAGQKLAGLAMAGASLDALLRLEDVFLTGKGTKEPFSAKIGKFPTKATREAMGPDLIDQLNALMQRVADTRPRRLALAAIERSLALHRFAARLLPWLETEKQRRGYLDFEDLILRARALLTDPSVAQWVLYKLDGGIDHILVDEAQDTSPAQWDVIRALAAEFASGEGARGEVQRTIFVVGDKKQSIYSFQGADPAGFDRLQTHFAAALEGSDTPLQTEELAHSFRSAPAILEAVDASFPGVSGLGDHPHHIAFKDQMPGRVDLWPVVEKLDSKDDRIWYEPVDKISPAAPPARLADAIAGHLRDLLAAGTQLPDGKGGARLMHPGDVLILVRSRGVLFNELIRACKAADLPLAGADRIKLHEELAVLDLIALLKFLALPEDDLSLATLLRSPFFGWSEDDLFRLAHPRPQGAFLWEFLRQSEAHPETRAVLDDLRSQADYLRPYELMQRLLIRHGGREKLLARLGPDCEEGVDALLQLALSYEQAEVPSLSGFLEWFAAEEVEIKRQVEGAGGNIRIMTVHGSKGLEAPVVILPDCGPVQERLRAMVHKSQAGWPVWLPDGADSTPPQLDPVRDAWISAQAAERDRLLYVAMTRAEIWLMAANAGDLGKKETWYSKIETGLRSRGAAR
ncbi:MAG: double-strand break repair helicase AddA, partial [Mangrovicoccus sp.]